MGQVALLQAQAKRWEQRYPSDLTSVISVNLSPRPLQRPDLVRDVEEASQEPELDPERLILEIAESAVIGNIEHHVDTLRRLRALGGRFPYTISGWATLPCPT